MTSHHATGAIRSRPATGRQGAFTLVELLVVIGIIAILIAILMPALGRARDQANGVKCAANMRQLMTGALMFAQDHKGHLFGNWSDANNPDEEKRDFLAGSTMDWRKAPQAGTLWRYVKSAETYRCPSRVQGEDTIGGGYSNGHFDYSACLMLTGARVSNVKQESRYVFVPSSIGNLGENATAALGMGPTETRPTPVFVEETSFRLTKYNIEGGWSNVDEHSDHHRGGSYYASIDGSVHWFNGRRKAMKNHNYGSTGGDAAEAWQWVTVSPTRGQVQMGQYGKQWGWFDSARPFGGS